MTSPEIKVGETQAKIIRAFTVTSAKIQEIPQNGDTQEEITKLLTSREYTCFTEIGRGIDDIKEKIESIEHELTSIRGTI